MRAAGLLFVLLLGCTERGASTYRGSLAVDIRDQVDVTILLHEGGSADVTLAVPATGFGLFEAAGPLSAAGRVEPFPEADLLLYTGRFRAAPRAGGPCGAQPVSLALSLSRREKNDRVGGSLTAYCGADRYAGVPARVLRLSGDLPLAPFN